MDTPDQRAADSIGKVVDSRIATLTAERALLANATTRIVEIDAELTSLQTEKARIDPRRPPREVIPAAAAKVDAPVGG